MLHYYIWNFVLELGSVCLALVISAALIYGTSVIIYYLYHASGRITKSIELGEPNDSEGIIKSSIPNRR